MKKHTKQSLAINDSRYLRVSELLRICDAHTAAGRKLPGHVVRELVFLRRHWGERTIPHEAVLAVPLIEREFDNVDKTIGIVSGRSHVGVTASWEQDER